jgi:hypothetical protein
MLYLVVENANIGWSTIQTIIEKGYQNLYYSPKSDNLDVIHIYKIMKIIQV